MAEPKLALIPSGVADNQVFSILPSNGDGDFDFSRGSTATRVNSQGLIETVSNDLPRLNYPLLDGKVVGCPSLLLEPAKTNQLQRSQEFENAYWINNGVTITANNTISPDGTLNADLLIGVSGGFGVVRFSAWTATNKVASCFAKKGSTSAFEITNGSLSYIGVAFNLENGTVTNEYSGFEGSIEDYGNGWYRCTAIDTLGRNGTFSLNVTSASESVYLWGAQLESDYETSYITTTTSAVTRLIETCNGAGTSDTFNDSEGTLMVQTSALADGENYMTISLNDGTASNHISLLYRGIANQVWMQTSGGGSNTNIVLYDVAQDINNKIALFYSSNLIKIFINGFLKRSTNITALPTGLNSVEFNNGAQSETFYGNTKQLQYFDTALTDSKLEQLTSWVSFQDMALALNYTIQ